MWVTPRMTDIFILKELRKLRWLTARLQIWGGRRGGCHAGASLPSSACLSPLGLSTICHLHSPSPTRGRTGCWLSTDGPDNSGPTPALPDWVPLGMEPPIKREQS